MNKDDFKNHSKGVLTQKAQERVKEYQKEYRTPEKENKNDQ